MALKAVTKGAISGGNRPMADAISQRLREDILEGRLMSGQRLPQEDIARRVGSSRIPVREAFRQLESEGLVTIVPNSGARVVKLDLAELNEIYLVRERLDPLAIAMSAPNLTEDQLTKLRVQIQEMEGIGQSETPTSRRRWTELDTDFHLATYAGMRMPRLMRLVEGLLKSAQPYRRVYTGRLQNLTLQNSEHRLLFDALEQHDSQGAELILQLHIRRTRLELIQHPEIFRGR